MRCPSCGNHNRSGAHFCDSCGASLEAPAPERPTDPSQSAAAPEVIADRYVVAGMLGLGGRKRVYRAHDSADRNREVAVAVFETEGVEETVLARARREVLAMTKLGNHPHVVRVLDAGEEDRVPYIVSEYVGGGDLAGLLERSERRRLEVETAVSIAIDVCRALEHAHARGIVHRDLKPANVWLGDDGTARLGDFGLATVDRRSRAAVEGMLVGTVAYMPPEQGLGRASEPRSDLYSLGAMLYELLTGEPPFPGEDAVAIIAQHLNAEPVAPSRHRPELAAGLDNLVLELLAKAPGDRPSGAAAVRRALEGLAGEPAADDQPAVPDDNPLEGLAGGVFVGRERELERMRGLLEESLAGQGRMLLLSGDPGIGKTRTAEQLATYAGIRGARVYWGRCHDTEGAPPYWPWSEAIRAYTRDVDPVGLRWQLGTRAGDIAQIVPELAERLGEVSALPPVESEQARFRLFDSVAGFLTEASQARPLVLVLDDLHWADEPSLLLLRFVARRLTDSGLLVVGAYRDVELGRHHPLAATLAELAEVEATQRIGLHGLDTEAIASYIELTAGVERPPADLAVAIREQTGGNPFFVGEVVRLMATEGRLEEAEARREVAIPQSVREVVGRRLDRLSASANEVLRLAAICGREFELAVLELISDLPPAAVAAALEEAEDARLIVASDRSGVYRFAHALVGETLHAEVPAARCAVVHRAVAEAIEEVHAADLEPYLGAVAHHYLEAGTAAEIGRTVEHAARAAQLASDRLAHEDAAALLDRALGVLNLDRTPDPLLRLGLLLDLGVAQTRAARWRDARATLERAADVARELGRPIDFARAVVAVTATSEAGIVDEPMIDLLEEALEMIGEADSPLRSELLSGLSQQLNWVDPAGRGERVGLEAIEIARRIGDSRSLAQALIRRQFLGQSGREHTERRLRESDQLHELAKSLGDLELELRAHVYRLRNRLELGDIAGVDADLAAFERLANLLRQPGYLWHVPLLRAARAMIDGRFADAERLSDEALAGGERAQEPIAVMLHATQAVQLRRTRRTPEDRRALEASVAELGRLAERYPTIPAWRASLAATHAELGDASAARAAFEPLAANGFADLPHDLQWPIALALLAETAIFLGDVPRAERLYELMLPLDGITVIAGRAAACYGPVARYLGGLAALTGRGTEARRHLADALGIAEAMGDRPLVAAARVQLAELLLGGGGEGGDRERALDLLGEALAEAQRLGMVGLTERALKARLEAQGLATIDASTSIDLMAEVISSEQPDIAAHAAADGHLTILFSDIEDSTLITERLGDERWLDVLRAHNSVFRRLVPAHGGFEVKNQGDGFMLVFPDARRAVECAVQIQRALAEGELVAGERVRVRMGMHAGRAIREDGDFFGRSVVVAARIAAQARGGEVLVSESVKQRAEQAGGDGTPLGFDAGYEVELKGLAGSHRLFRTEWEPVPPV